MLLEGAGGCLCPLELHQPIGALVAHGAPSPYPRAPRVASSWGLSVLGTCFSSVSVCEPGQVTYFGKNALGFFN